MSVVEGEATNPNPHVPICMDQQQLRDLLLRVASHTGVPGIAAAVSVGGTLVSSTVGTNSARTNAPFPQNARFALGCISKLLVAIVCAKLISEGSLDLDSPLDALMVAMRNTTRGRSQSLRHLMTLTSGYQDMNLESVVNQRWAEFSEARQLFLPGIVFSYEHAAYGVVGEALQVILGQNLDTILFERLLEPLGFSSGKLGDDRCSDIPNVVGHEYNAQTRTFVPAVVQTFPSNGALSCVTMSFQDLAMLAQTLATRAVAVGSAAGINCQSVSLLETRHACLPALVEGTKPIGLPIGFGLGCAHYSNGLFGFDGSFMGQACGIRYDPIQRIGIVVGVNVASSNVRSGVIDAILRSIGLVDDIAATHMRREYDFDLELLPGLYVGADHSEVLIARSAGMFSFDFKLSGRATRLKLTTRYDPQLNRIFVTGAGQQCGLAVFLEPGGQHPCVAMGLTVYKKQYLVDGEPT